MTVAREQRLAALRQANRVRFWRAEFKRELRRASPSLSAGLASQRLRELPPELESFPALAFLRAVRMVGPRRANAMLKVANVHPKRTLRELTLPQRRSLIQQLVARERSALKAERERGDLRVAA